MAAKPSAIAHLWTKSAQKPGSTRSKGAGGAAEVSASSGDKRDMLLHKQQTRGDEAGAANCGVCFGIDVEPASFPECR